MPTETTGFWCRWWYVEIGFKIKYFPTRNKLQNNSGWIKTKCCNLTSYSEQFRFLNKKYWTFYSMFQLSANMNWIVLLRFITYPKTVLTKNNFDNFLNKSSCSINSLTKTKLLTSTVISQSFTFLGTPRTCVSVWWYPGWKFYTQI